MEKCSYCHVSLDPDNGPYLRTFKGKGKKTTCQVYCDYCSEKYFGIRRVGKPGSAARGQSVGYEFPGGEV